MDNLELNFNYLQIDQGQVSHDVPAVDGDRGSQKCPCLVPNWNQLLPTADSEKFFSAPLSMQWECSRAAIHYNCPLIELFPSSEDEWKSCDKVWAHITRNRRRSGSSTILRTRADLEAWNDVANDVEKADLHGTLFLMDWVGNDLTYRIQLRPLQSIARGQSNRYQRAFGGHRILSLEIQISDNVRIKGIEKAHRWLKSWLLEEKTFLGHVWRVLHLRDKKRKNFKAWEAKLFAIKKQGLSQSDNNEPYRIDAPLNGKACNLEQALDWFLPLRQNGSKLSCKMYARWELGLSKTFSTIVFDPKQIYPIDDLLADGSPEDDTFNDTDDSPGWATFAVFCEEQHRMTDGCGRIAIKAANEIWRLAGKTGPSPCVFQGRTGNAKGLWVKSSVPDRDEKDPIWIETTESQRKFELSGVPNSHHTTFDLLNWSSPPSYSHLSESHLSILEDRGISKQSLAQLVRTQFQKEQEELLQSLANPPLLLAWVSEHLPHFEAEDEPEAFQGSMPKSLEERINLLLKTGFHPDSCFYLSSLMKKAVEKWLRKLCNDLKVPIPMSTSVFGIPDFQRVLNPGEVYLAFSQGSPDNRRPCLFNQDVLIGRFPMHRSSDIQRVKAVFAPELEGIYDAIVFPTKGCYPLARKMSNGDYDGDTYWVCWEPELVKSFKNSPPPLDPDPEAIGIDVDKESLEDSLVHGVDGFLSKNFDFVLKESMLGLCSDLQGRYVYKTNNLHSEEFKGLADLRDVLVDAPKNGYRFSKLQYHSWINQNLRDCNYPKPAYAGGGGRPNLENVVDFLKFFVIDHEAEIFQKAVNSHFTCAEKRDNDLSALFDRRYQAASEAGDSVVCTELDAMAGSIELIIRNWTNARAREYKKGNGFENYDEDIERAYEAFIAIEPLQIDQEIIREWAYPNLDHGPSTWALLRASALFSRFADKNQHLLFTLAGKELFYIKPFQTDANSLTITSDVLGTMRVRKSKVGKGIQR